MKFFYNWPNSLDCTDLNQCGARRDAELCRLCYKQVLLQKAGLKCLNEAVASMTAVSVWKSKTVMDPLGKRIFNQKTRLQCTRSGTSKEICLPVPGYPTLSTNIMARIWNAVPGLQHASTLGAAK